MPTDVQASDANLDLTLTAERRSRAITTPDPSPSTATPTGSRHVGRWIAVGAVVLVVLLVGGPFLYIHAFSSDAPPPLTLDAGATGSNSSTSTTAKAATNGTLSAGSTGTTVPVGTTDRLPQGVWNVTSGSQAGYRVKEVLFGQSTEAVGRTTAVTGSMTITATAVSATEITIDLTQVTSDKSQRDDQFQGRIMNTDTYPTATFKLTQPIDLSFSAPDGNVEMLKATGDLTLHGTTKSVTVDLSAKQVPGGTTSVSGSIPVVFADYGIDNPSGGPATTEDNGTIEFLVVFAQA